MYGKGAIGTLFRRNEVAETHRGSGALEYQTSKRQRKSPQVLGFDAAVDSFAKFFLESEQAWINCNDYLRFGSQGDDIFRIGRVHKITLDQNSRVNISVYVCNEAKTGTQRPLDLVSKRYVFQASPDLLHEIVLDGDDGFVCPQAMQPDFISDGIYECPFMSILS